MKRRGALFVLSAPSGAGKSTLIERAVREIPNIWHSVSATTRAPRHYEKEDVHYHFTDQDTFHRMIKEEKFLEWAKVHGEYYGTPAESVDRRLGAGGAVIMDLDVQGALQVKKRRPETTLIFIMPPSIEELRKRMEGRRAETDERIRRRLSVAEEEMSQRGLYDHVIVNEDIEDAFRDLCAIIRECVSAPDGGPEAGSPDAGREESE